MSEEDVRRYLTGKSQPSSSKRGMATKRVARRLPQKSRPEADSFENFSASHIFCPTCRKATPVRERLLLFLPDGDLYDYSCTVCATSVGTRKAGR